jgi:hypothetical protein
MLSLGEIMASKSCGKFGMMPAACGHAPLESGSRHPGQASAQQLGGARGLEVPPKGQVAFNATWPPQGVFLTRVNLSNARLRHRRLFPVLTASAFSMFLKLQGSAESCVVTG